jgi:hypothetical protein
MPETPLAGDLYGVVIWSASEPDGTLRLLATHVWLTPQGNLYSVALPALIPMTGTVYEDKETNTIVGGSGKYKGATGTIDLTGPFDLSTGAGSISYSGKITLPQ